jgi:hypothetical protein
MPVIHLPDKPDVGVDARAFLMPIFSSMLFPKEKDAAARRAWLASAMAHAYMEWLKVEDAKHILPSFHIWIPGLLACRQGPERVFSDGLKRSARAELSGGVLRILLSCVEHHPRHAKIERAVALLSRQLSELKQRSEKSFGASESLIQKAWSEFRPAAHLWASWLSVWSSGFEIDSDADWLVLMSCAQGYLDQAAQARFLLRGESWVLPPDKKVPTVEVENSPLSEADFSWLDEQFPG